jgi:hypothetical protein
LAHICGTPPTKNCKYEGDVNGPVLKTAPVLLPKPSNPKSPKDIEPADDTEAPTTEPASDTAPAAEPPKPNEPPKNAEPPKQPEPPNEEGKQHLGAALPPLNPAVTEDTLQSTTCVHGWTTTVRSSFFARQQMKLEKMKALGATDATAYQLDHIVPLCLGGSLDNPKNLQLQLWSEATRKDRMEIKLCCLVCTGQVGLAEARLAILDWQTTQHTYAKIKCRRK